MHQDLEQRLDYLEACEAIRALIGRYATAADQRNNPAILQHLFHEDALWCAEGFGEYQGREQILAALSNIAQAQVLWSLHIMALPDIQITAQDQATATWMLWEVCTLAKQPASITDVACHLTPAPKPSTSCLGGFYHTQIRRNAQGEWRFDRVELKLTFNQAYPQTETSASYASG